MNLEEASSYVLKQLELVLQEVSAEDYNRPLLSLNKATLGQHVRHTMEFYICLLEGLKAGKVNYDSRKRDLEIETNPVVALERIQLIRREIQSVEDNPKIILEGSYSHEGEAPSFSITSNFERELAYNIEHAIHHMAIIKIGLAETHPAMELPVDFGVAVSTVRHQN